jgi:DNA-binding transcriptional regulator LsrR (DeoR family)
MDKFGLNTETNCETDKRAGPQPKSFGGICYRLKAVDNALRMKNIAHNEKKIKPGGSAISVVALSYDDESALAARAAWMHFAGGKTQGEVAELLGVQSTKAHRLIARARSDGLIRVFVEGPIAGCIALEERLQDRFHLQHCEVVPNIDDGPLPLKTLGMAGARYLRGLIDNKKYDLIGVGHGRTLAAAADMLPGIAARGTRFVSLLGGLTRRFAASPFEVVHRIAERTGAEAYFMPVPFIANSQQDRKVLESQLGVADVIAMARNAPLYLAGIGEVSVKGFLATGGMVDEADVEAARLAGAAGEILGHFFSVDGQHVPNSASERALSPRLSDLKQRKIVALAGGSSKMRALRAVLSSGIVQGLITDETTARGLVQENPRKSGNNKNGKTAGA